ncbi:hypothetical protein CDAR_506101 [Caerostris darwini]|uniref:Uncharacterized protein n=1 Tax=Caerostris darwini TaxID=1538125 RepID=A0AAV4WIK4_9ARAC|nr:hypothetical protein CDAR_506101 [Caerostris darwini]
MQIDRDYHRPDWTLDELHPRNFLDEVPMGPLHVLPWMSWGDRLQIAQWIIKVSIRLAELDSSNHWIGCNPSSPITSCQCFWLRSSRRGVGRTAIPESGNAR